MWFLLLTIASLYEFEINKKYIRNFKVFKKKAGNVMASPNYKSVLVLSRDSFFIN